MRGEVQGGQFERCGVVWCGVVWCVAGIEASSANNEMCGCSKTLVSINHLKFKKCNIINQLKLQIV
jgi:hypothetical protein